MRFRTLAALIAGIALSSPAAALTFVDIDGYDGIRLSSGGTNSLGGTFDITTGGIEGDVFSISHPYSWKPLTIADRGGFEVGTHRTVGASVLLVVRDDFDLRLEFMLVELGGVQGSGPIEVDFDIERMGVDASLYAMIDGTGQLDWDIVARHGDFRVDYVALVVKALKNPSGPAGPAIPEVNAFAAYAVGTLLVVGVMRRRR